MVATLFGALAGGLGFLLIAFSLPGFYPIDPFSVLVTTVACAGANGLLSAVMRVRNLEAIRGFGLLAAIFNALVFLLCDVICDGFYVDGVAVLLGGALLLAIVVTLTRSFVPVDV
jgi:uncharacterized membrane protein YvlD (DUF360 family)